jgi:acylpyruvate hydrolase
MRLATVVSERQRIAVCDQGDGVARALPAPDVGSLLRAPDWQTTCSSARDEVDLAGAEFLPLIPEPEKIICIGLNYRSHILEMGRELPTHPTLFAKYHRALIGANEPVILPAPSTSAQMDWEVELAVIVGHQVRNATPESAVRAIAGYTVINDVTARDWQRRTEQWLQGKTWEKTTPLGPWLVTADEADPAGEGRPDLQVRCEIDGEIVQEAKTSDLVFGPADLVAYISTIITLAPGDVIASGTPGGVGVARTPQRFLQPGNVLTTTIEGIGSCRNPCVAEAVE